MNDSFSIQVASESDDAAIVRLLVNAFSCLYESLGLQMSAERHIYLCDQASRRSFSSSLICHVDGEAAGTITLVPPSGQCRAWIENAWEVRLLAVSPKMQGRGIARALLHDAERRASEGGAYVLCLHARCGIPVQVKFYPAAGYLRDTAGDKNATPFREGYRKQLGPPLVKNEGS